MVDAIARRATAVGRDAAHVARTLIAGLGTEAAGIVLVFADWRIDAAILATTLQDAFGDVPVVGCTTLGVVAAPAVANGQPEAVAIALGGGTRAGIGIATELSTLALARSRDAVHHAAHELDRTLDTLDPSRHVMLTLVDGGGTQQEAFCIGAAAPAPQIKVVGGAAASDVAGGSPALVWARGEVFRDAAIVVVLDCPLPFHVVTSSHLVPTDVRLVVTAATGRTIEELDGRPAAPRLRDILAKQGIALGDQPTGIALARYIDGVPYVRAATMIVGDTVQMAGAVEAGHVLRLMRPGDLIGTTRRDLAQAAERVGGEIVAFVAFSCIGRHWEAKVGGLEAELAAVYAERDAVGFQSFGEHAGMLFVNHTLTGLAIGVRR